MLLKQMEWASVKEVQCIAPPEGNCHNPKNTTFQDRGNTTGWGIAIASKE
jgi:hypothetical protein